MCCVMGVVVKDGAREGLLYSEGGLVNAEFQATGSLPYPAVQGEAHFLSPARDNTYLHLDNTHVLSSNVNLRASSLQTTFKNKVRDALQLGGVARWARRS